jgi:transglutaminase-like putative cysteine protease
VTPRRYRVDHVTRYVHRELVSTSHHVAYLRPRELPWQHVLAHRIEFSPTVADEAHRRDYFGNAVDHFSVLSPYRELRVSALSTVDVVSREVVDPAESPAWEDARPAANAVDGPLEFSVASPYVQDAPVLLEYATVSFPPRRPVLDGALDLMHRIHREFRFDAGATTVTTPVERIMELRQGVCQDFAHVGIACLRSLGLAARYVSGYLLTNPPPGQPRLQGADASHAWLAVHCPHVGWVDLDPTNDLMPGDRHVTLAWGRDYGDVSPLRGVVLGGGPHVLHVGVNVEPVDVTH